MLLLILVHENSQVYGMLNDSNFLICNFDYYHG